MCHDTLYMKAPLNDIPGHTSNIYNNTCQIQFMTAISFSTRSGIRRRRQEQCNRPPLGGARQHGSERGGIDGAPQRSFSMWMGYDSGYRWLKPPS